MSEVSKGSITTQTLMRSSTRPAPVFATARIWMAQSNAPRVRPCAARASSLRRTRRVNRGSPGLGVCRGSA